MRIKGRAVCSRVVTCGKEAETVRRKDTRGGVFHMLIWVHSVTALKGPEDNDKDEMTLPPGLQIHSWSAL